MLADHIIEEGTLRRTGDRVSVSVRLPWYRALPLSSITDVELEVDGVPLPHDGITFTVNGRDHRLDDLPPLHTEWWYVLDSARLAGDLPAGWPTADSVAVRVRIGAYIPYLPAGPGFIKIGEQDRKTLVVGQEPAA
jgi:hypothetical protein